MSARPFPITAPPGTFSDDTTLVPIPTGPKVVDTNNMRFRDGMAQNIGGWQAETASGISNIRNILPVTDETNGIVMYVFGGRTELMVRKTNTNHTITPSGWSAGTANTTDPVDIDDRTMTWAFSRYGQTVIAHATAKTIYQWSNDTGVAAAAITNAPAKCNYGLAIHTRQVMAFGCNEESGGAYNPRCIRWSDIEDITDWTTAADSNAGEHILEGSGLIVAAVEVGEIIVIFTLTDVWTAQFIGQPDQTFLFRKVADKCGLIGANAFAVTGQTIYWMAPDLEVRVWDLGVGGIPQVLPSTIRNEMVANMATSGGVFSQGPKITATTINKFKEVWFFYPDSRDGSENSRYVAYCIDESMKARYPVWFRGRMARTAACDSDLVSYPVMASPGGTIYFHENGATKTEDGSDGSDDWHITIADISAKEGSERLFVQGIIPDFKSQAGTVTLTPYTRPYAQGTETTHSTQSLTTSTAKKDFRVSGMILRLKFSGSSASDFMRMGWPKLMVTTGGGR